MCKVTDWLSQHDQRLYADGVKISAALAMCQRETRETVSKRAFKRARDEACRYYRKLPMRIFSHQETLDGQQWDAVRAWIRKNKAKIEAAQSVEVVARLMRADSVVVNPTLLRNSCSFRDVWVRDMGRQC